jgi:ABC-type dipeptide/oligopeptide/nickel transport system permease subunit
MSSSPDRHVPLLARLLRNARVWFGTTICTLLVLTALFAPWISPMDPLEQDLLSPLEKPIWLQPGQITSAETGGLSGHFLGTDNLGRDVLSRLVYGARTALIVALAAALGSALVGTAIGAWAGWAGGRVDAWISRLMDVWMSFPPVLLAVVLVAVMGTGLGSVIMAIVVVDWTRFARVVRAETRSQATLDYVTSARMLGLPGFRIVLTEIGPNLMPLLITLVTMEMGVAIVVETILSFVGLSVASGASTWGGMLGEGRLYVNQAPWLMGLPMLMTMISVIGLNALGDGLRRELDPVVRS